MQSSTWSRWTLFGIIGFAYVVRIMMMPTTGQNDVLFMPWMAQNLTLSSPNIYANLYEAYGEIVLSQPAVWAPYPYGFYLLTALWSQLIEVISGIDFQTWNATWNVEKPASLVFFFKLIYLPFDLFILALLYKQVGHFSSLLWAWAPAAIYTPFMMGQNDIYATACSVAAIGAFVYYIRLHSEASSTLPPYRTRLGQSWLFVSMVLLGIGATFKIFPLVLLPPLLLSIPLSWRTRLWLGLTSIGIFLISVVPFITTKAFFEGVLFNPEGSQLFRRTDIFGLSIPLFILCYGLLLFALLIREYRLQNHRLQLQAESSAQELARFRPSSPWLVTALVLALLFLLIPTPLYWLIWITPMLAAAAQTSKTIFAAWFLTQSGFTLTLPSLHRELGVALPTHLVDGFDVPNLPTALQLELPLLGQLYSYVQSFATGIMLSGFVLTIGFTLYQSMIQPRHVEVASNGNGKGKRKGNAASERLLASRPWVKTLAVILPAVLLFVGLGFNLYIGRNLVDAARWQAWEPFELGANKSLRQAIDPPSGTIHGAWIKIVDAPHEEVLELCIYGGDIQEQTAPIRCAEANTSQQISEGKLYFRFDSPIEADLEQLSLRARSDAGVASRVVLEVSESDNFGLIEIDSRMTHGHANLSLLTSFQARQVFQELLVKNIFEEKQLLIWLTCVLISVLLLIYALLWSQRPMLTDAQRTKTAR